FQPTGEGQVNPGPGSSGRTDENGAYSLQVIGVGAKGAVVGLHRVEVNPTVDNPDDDGPRKGGPAPKLKIPTKYNFKSVLKFEVKPGDNTINIALSSKESK